MEKAMETTEIEKTMETTVSLYRFGVWGGNEGMERRMEKLLKKGYQGLMQGSIPSFLANQRPVTSGLGFRAISGLKFNMAPLFVLDFFSCFLEFFSCDLAGWETI